MGVSKVITVVCDYSGCKGGVTGPTVVSWNETLVNQGRAELPEEAKYLVIFSQTNEQGNRQFSFCCQLHAAEYFLPPGYEAKQKQVIELPSTPKKESRLTKIEPELKTWMDDPMRTDADVREQPLDSPDNGQESA